MDPDSAPAPASAPATADELVPGLDDALPAEQAPALLDEGLESSRPPHPFRMVRHWVLDSVEQLSALRDGILRELAAEAADPAVVLDDVADDMVLIATELATNAIRHGLPPTEVQLGHTGHVYLLDIADRATDDAPYLAGTREPGLGGFGMHIARQLAVDVGWYADDDVKHVWAILPAPSPPASSAG